MLRQKKEELYMETQIFHHSKKYNNLQKKNPPKRNQKSLGDIITLQ